MSLFDSLLVKSLPYVPRALVKRVARPYVAGEGDSEALALTAGLNHTGFRVTLDVLGEDITVAAEAAAAAAEYRSLLAAIATQEVDANVSLKLSQFGLKLDRKLCQENLRSVVEEAKRLGNFVRIDMEDSSCTDATLEIYRDLRSEFDNVGIVLQACLKRTLDDARALAPLRPNVRVCKGIYVEPRAIAWHDRERVRESFMATVEALLDGGSYVAIATHDEVLVQNSETLIRDRGLPRRGRFEFQMLLGVREGLRDEIAATGCALRVYVPFGRQWYAYSLRRLRENPAMARHVVRALILGDRGRRLT